MSNINADKGFVLQLVIAGQPELRDALRQPVLELFAQHIAVDYHLEGPDARETRECVAHRSAVADGAPGTLSRDTRLRVRRAAAAKCAVRRGTGLCL